MQGYLVVKPPNVNPDSYLLRRRLPLLLVASTNISDSQMRYGICWERTSRAYCVVSAHNGVYSLLDPCSSLESTFRGRESLR